MKHQLSNALKKYWPTRARFLVIGLVAFFCLFAFLKERVVLVTSIPSRKFAPIPSRKLSNYEEEQVIVAKKFARDIALNQLPKHEYSTPVRIPNTEWHIDMDVVNNAINSPEGCMVYSFGVAEWDGYTDFLARKGCKVYAFDPTQRHEEDWMPNVKFYPWGLRNSESTKEWSHPVYGDITGNLFTFAEIIQKLGHDDGRTITAIKFDCEGCEYAAFKDLVMDNVKNPILNIATEFHFSTTLGLRNDLDVAQMVYTLKFLSDRSCRVLHKHDNAGFQHDRDNINPTLLEGGLPEGVCCYEYVFVCK